jgi:hypothetical protein
VVFDSTDFLRYSHGQFAARDSLDGVTHLSNAESGPQRNGHRKIESDKRHAGRQRDRNAV